MTSGALQFRTPERTWMILSAVAALCLHGLLWLVAAWLVTDTKTPGGTLAEVLGEVQRQMVLAAFWVVASLVLWKITLPPSRLHALVIVLCGALFITLAGNIAALLNYMIKGATLTQELISAFTIYRGLKGLGELALSIPTAIALQGLALSRKII
ncbi:hypothetical protein [Asticcacaulis sp. AC402]|uniref:hypothetical protein n=1 Tax=Asticcacaulis sp. AC402 TaxID=1282361 RepID=UPI0003C3DF4C|nr:hypothetical protein [Asticcacaulis sp. AC402]ESQ77174.1 hypothetical protein ABAC402_01880 [Asticcacaulis sp. AC402]